MITNIRSPKGENGSPQVSRLPEPSANPNIFDVNLVQALANELYTAIPGRSSATNQVNQAQTTGEATTPTIPQADSDTSILLANLSQFKGVEELPLSENEAKIPDPSLTEVTKGGTTAETDALSLLAQQLYAQMSSASLDPAMQQAIAGLDSAPFIPEKVSPFASKIAPNQTISTEALNTLVQQLETPLPSIFPQKKTVQSTKSDISQVETPLFPEQTSQPSFYFLSEPKIEHLDLKSDTPFDVEVIRRDFPILHQKVNGKPLIWFDNAATTQKPQSVIEAISQFYERDNSNIHRGAHTLAARATDAYEAARETVQRFLGASSASEIIFARGTTEAINLVAQTWGRKYIREGDEIILSTLEHHANIVPWQMLAQETGAILKVIPVTDAGEIILEEYARLLGPRTRLVSVTQVSNALGTIIPVREITTMAHRHNARVLIDGAQGVPHLPVNVQDLDCDFYVFSGHKLFAPTGIGVLYGKQEILEDIPPWQGGGSMIRDVTFEHTTYSDPPAKFEAGTPNIADAVGLGAAIDYLNRIGLGNIEEYERKLTCYATKRLGSVPGLHLIGTTPHKVGVFSFQLADLSPEVVGKHLDLEGIAVRAGHHCAQPTMQRYGVKGTVRPSLAFYNTCAEIDTLVEVLKNIRYR